MRKRVARVTMAIGLLLGFGAGAASAAGGYEYRTASDLSVGFWNCPHGGIVGDEYTHASGCFVPYGDYMVVSDEAWDGRRAGLIWRNPASGRKGICANVAGGGDVRECDYNFPEGSLVYYYAATCDGDRYNCEYVSSWRQETGEIRVRNSN